MHYLRKHLTNRRISSVRVQEDDIVYGKVGCSASAFKSAMTGKTILDARQQGKYFWLVMDSAPHPLMHLGMTGWMKFSNDDTAYYRPKKEEESEWPPRFWKFVLEMEDKSGEDGKCEVAFVDARRLARIRLIDAEADAMRKTTPLKENGPDPVVDKDILTVEWLSKKMRSKRVPVKALLLDQANISGVGNWVADEVLYQARIHPEQYSNTFSDEQMKQLHDALISVTTTACETLADSSRFPENWLMKYRWDKGKKDANVLPNGEKIVHLKVGGRTSAIVPSVQKKTGAVAGDVGGDEGGSEDAEEKKPAKRGRGQKRAANDEDEDDVVKEEPKLKGRRAKVIKKQEEDKKQEEEKKPAKKARKGRGKTKKEESEEKDDDEASLTPDEESAEEEAPKPTRKKTKTAAAPAAKATNGQSKGTRRSARNAAR